MMRLSNFVAMYEEQTPDGMKVETGGARTRVEPEHLLSI